MFMTQIKSKQFYKFIFKIPSEKINALKYEHTGL